MKLIIGLGNPGTEHEGTRHNAGFLVIDSIISNIQYPITLKLNKKTNALAGKGEINKKRVIVAKPLTFMNNSGLAVRALLDFYKLKPENLIVIHDDKDIPLGETRVQTDRGPAGHNGVKSIIEHLGTKNFARIRVGVALESQNQIKNTANFVLGKFTAEEKKILNKVIQNVIIEIEGMV